ncbi:MAG: hypothetical protein ACD_45C00541G0001 [uncultured bacterium]|nr:MAG: hypothetical protein ACD_45C00541G0001 [uncultured bacterium]OGT56320.1 MAG: hypothetical protein A3F43_00770 [Gammaproteobacteria bacterium RIFCSPHIGHO2_12_FULL_42_10]
MPEDNVSSVVVLQDVFYRDGYSKVIGLGLSVVLAIALVCSLSIYLHIIKPAPVTFLAGDEWRIQPAVALDRPLHAAPYVLQWVSDVLPRVLQYDFYNYDSELKEAMNYFTADGWSVFLNQLDHYANRSAVVADKMFVQVTPLTAPFILNQGLLAGRYGWWVQIPITMRYLGMTQRSSQSLTVQVLVTRVPTLNNLSGIGINNIIVQHHTTANVLALKE